MITHITTSEPEDSKMFYTPRRKKHSFVDFCMMKQNDIIEKFSTLKDAKVVTKDEQERFIFVPGTREDRVLLVAHGDNFWCYGKDEPEVEVLYDNGKYFSGSKKHGIGADDRAGVTMLWKLKDLGHSLLIPFGEERGCKGSRFLMSLDDWKKTIDEHKFAIEIDRHGGNDLVFYQVGSQKFEKWCEDQFKGYKRIGGSYTDICQLCKKMCGLNISCGYYREHGSEEHLIEKEWCRTLSHLHNVLKMKDLPRFEQPTREYHSNVNRGTTFSSNCLVGLNTARMLGYNSKKQDSYNSDDSYYHSFANYKQTKVNTDLVRQIDGLVMCGECEMIQDSCELVANNLRCLGCNKEI